ncbi:GH92 family glycosyl hydrolase [Prolixibacteraceae bacterium Z1-6]|uniref:GH92 family glycosyl hydrolase n=1 Tax=Draconibacterium aestuarii TaxID=2998507 RepID=A0A9X3F4T4_9BACT|nr:GH92 family glycosyl hydrolase [Prolixibacteraceae bacterium Z1-6]
MKKITILLLAAILFSCQSKEQATQENLTSYVNTFVGTDGPGNTYPGAVVPFGMVQLSPDNGMGGWDRIAGYFWPDSTIAGFSHTHLSGTGAGDMYDLLLFPTNSRFTEDLWPDQENYRPYSKFSHEQEEASPGYYKVLLESSDITAELTTTERVGMHRYTFPEDTESKIILDLGYALNWDAPTETSIKIENDHTISGVRKSSGWAPVQHVFFVAEFSKPFDSSVLYSNNESVDSKEVNSKNTKFEANFNTDEGEQILVKVALSSASVEGARQNLEKEINHWDFDLVRMEADKVWEETLSTIKVAGSDYQKEVFYTNFYHLFLTPSLLSDQDGNYKGANHRTEKALDYKRYDTFSLWDTYRAAHPLYTIVCPDKVEDFVKSFLAHYNETGLLPVWSMAGNETNMMIGYHAVPVIVDAYFKGIPMDAEKAFEACKASGMNTTEEMKKYRELGYVPFNKDHENWSVSKTLEYAYDDWCIAQFAKALNKNEDYELFARRADNWKNLYDNRTNFFRAKDEAGNFYGPFVAKEYTDDYCESNAWQYLFAAQHDIEGFRDLMGTNRFEELLDSMFTYYPTADDELPIFSTGMIGQYAHGNEPSHHVPFLYNFIDKPEKGKKYVRKIIDTQYSNQPDGYCGNEDCGQMSAWYVFSTMGFYPVNPANGIYYIGSPSLNEAVIQLPNAKTFKMIAENNSEENVYIQSISLNGTEYLKDYITHKDIMNGGELHFVMGPNPRK